MSKSITLIFTEAAKFCQEHMGLVRTLKQEARMESIKMSYQPLSFDVFNTPQIEFQGIGDFSHNLQLPEVLEAKGDTEVLTPVQREGLKTLGRLCGDMGYGVELGELQGTASSKNGLAIPVYITINDNHVSRIFTHGDYSFSHNQPFPEFQESKFFDQPAHRIKAIPSFDESLTLDSLFQSPATRIEREKVRIRRNGGGNA